MNTHIRDNLEAVKDPEGAFYDAVEGSDLALSSTSFADVDATANKFEFTITTTGSPVVVSFNAAVGVSASLVVYLDVSVDGTAYGVTTLGAADGLYAKLITSGGPTVDGALEFWRFLTQVTAGTHVFRLRYKVSTGTLTVFRAAGTANADIAPQFFVREMS